MNNLDGGSGSGSGGVPRAKRKREQDEQQRPSTNSESELRPSAWQFVRQLDTAGILSGGSGEFSIEPQSCRQYEFFLFGTAIICIFDKMFGLT